MTFALIFASCVSSPNEASAEITSGGNLGVVIKKGPSTTYNGTERTFSAPGFGKDNAPISGNEAHCLEGGSYPWNDADDANDVVWTVSQSDTAVPTYANVTNTTGACTNGSPNVFHNTRCDDASTPSCQRMFVSDGTSSTTIMAPGLYTVTSKYTDGGQQTKTGQLVVRANEVPGPAAGNNRLLTYCFNDDFYFAATTQPKRGGGTITNATLDFVMTSKTPPGFTDGSNNQRNPYDDCNNLDGNADIDYSHGARYLTYKL